jgi:hypothetical protein
MLVSVLAVGGTRFCPTCSAQTNATNAAKLPARSFLGMGGIVTTPEQPASPRFVGTQLPMPPNQASAWSIPTSTLPTNYTSAAAALFEAGMADPRGCDYREIEVGTGEIWSGDGGVVKTHGWVFSGKERQPLAVCWNGLVYQTVSVGASADWRADALACLQKAGRQWRSALPEAQEVSYQTCLPLKGCLLLRLGEPKLARDLWLALQMGAQRDLNAVFVQAGATNSLAEPKSELSTNDPYLDWASNWAWDLFERTVCAHIRGDDGLALVSARLLASAQPRIESHAELRGFKRPSTFPSPRDGKKQAYLKFLGPLSALLKDQERRAQNHETGIATPTNIAELTNQAARISAWIDALDQVKVRQWAQPGGLGPWEGDPVVAGLLKEGEPAIEPLLQCLDSDCANRLTRSASFGRDFHRDRMPHFVSQPIVSVLLKLMNTSDAAVGFDRSALYWQGGSNAVLAAQFRNYRKEFGSLSPPERWFRKLADDTAGQVAWADALGNIVRAEKVETNTDKIRLAGEELRSKRSPSLTELLLRRSAPIAESAPGYNAFAINDAVGFLLSVEKWEAASPLLQQAAQFQGKIAANYAGTNNSGSADPQNATAIAALAMLRARHGDDGGLAEYAGWIRGANPTMLEDSALDALEPFWRFPQHPDLRAAAKELFGNTNSPWGTLVWLMDGHGGFLRSRKPLASPALVIPEFRALVIGELSNRTVAGNALNRGGGSLEVNYSAGTVNFGARKDTEGLEVGAKFVFRRCDVVVEQLAAIPGFPPISLLWPEAKRDEAVEAALKLLAESGDHLKPVEKPPGSSRALNTPLVHFEDR